jgi:hypothetical protein
MTDTNNSGVKYPRQLAINETSSRRQIDQLELFGNDEPDPLIMELKKSLYTFSIAYSIIFDGLSFACTTLFDKKWKDGTGERHDIIGRKHDKTETHYRLFAPDEIIKYIFTGPYESEWPNLRNQLMKLALYPEPKKLIIDEKHFIIDAPIKVTPWYEKDNIEKFTKLSPRRRGRGKGEAGKLAREASGERETGKAKGRIVGWSIEFFKPLFESLLHRNSGKRKTSAGKNYLITPPYFQLKLNAIYENILAGADSMMHQKPHRIEAIEEQKVSLFPQYEGIIRAEAEQYKQRFREYCEGLKNKAGSMTPLQARKFYMSLLMKDNHKGNYITIENLIELVDGIWPELIRTGRNGSKTLQPSDYEEAIKKIKFIMNVYFKMMAGKGDMDGGQLLPLAIIEEEKFTRETNKLRIRCIKQNTMFSKYRLEETAKYLAYDTPMEKG